MMRYHIGFAVLLTIGVTVIVPNASRPLAQTASPQPSTVNQTAGAEPRTAPVSSPSGSSFWDAIKAYPRPAIWGALLAVVIIIGGAVLLYRTVQAGADPLILRLTPSFFFW